MFVSNPSYRSLFGLLLFFLSFSRLVYLAAFDGFWVVNVINGDAEKGCLSQCIRMEETPRG